MNRIELGPVPERGEPWIYDEVGMLAQLIAEAVRR
jgi:hypothetical protein